VRLDNYLLEHGFAHSRNKAQELIASGLVSIDGVVCLKNSTKVQDERVRVKEHRDYVSRSAYKLDAFLDEISLSVEGRLALDVGSSTGGFTQVLLERGASEIYAVDVGRDQLHSTLRSDNRIKLFEGCDIRNFDAKSGFDLVVSDVSFISLHHILSKVDELSCDDIVLLFKPQYEVGKEIKRDRNGVVQDKKAVEMAMLKFEDSAFLLGWELVKCSASKLSGKEGNLEYCYYFKKVKP